MSQPEIVAGVRTRLAIAAGRMPSLGKTERNKEQGFAFRSIDAIVDAAKPILSDLGIAIVPYRILQRETQAVESSRGTPGWRTVVEIEYEVGCDVLVDAQSGAVFSDVLYAASVGEAIDYGDKSSTKAMQMAYKYLVTELLLVAAGDGDPDATTPDAGRRRRPADPVVTLKKRLVSEYGKEVAAAAWRTLFEEAEPDAETLTEERIAEIEIAIASIVEDLSAPMNGDDETSEEAEDE